ncbi:FAD binding domain-containing protein [Microbacterium sp. cf332]|uniref:FAD binding domain-containing protein n=1 Tax=Microbacterium sp. cf332 TaxID=1761804 RepID=UPI000886E8DD|nr:FAD binding domain-containing protein [Microbacterium sp. cf332]SDQ60997.1 CO or xanthine dehydrogenase, FAD-binding subunit [Microbacterium sp. cf332]
MDITTVTGFRTARTRGDLALAPGERFLAGGTWLMSEPQPETTGFVDLTTMGWPELEVDETGLRIAATCTIARLVAFAAGRLEVHAPADWAALDLVPMAANALLASFKIWNTATVGGNLCRAFAAGAMVSLCAALDGVAVIWRADGSEARMLVADLVVDDGKTCLAPGDLLRAIEIPAATLRSPAALHKIALAELGRSGAVVTGRLDGDGSATFTVTAAVRRPVVLRFETLPSDAALVAAVEAAPGYYSDPLGAADWRRGVSSVLARRVAADLRHGHDQMPAA